MTSFSRISIRQTDDRSHAFAFLLFNLCSLGAFDRRWAEHTVLDSFAKRLVAVKPMARASCKTGL